MIFLSREIEKIKSNSINNQEICHNSHSPFKHLKINLHEFNNKIILCLK